MNFEWLNIDPQELNYHMDQYEHPKQYTKELLLLFEEWGLSVEPGGLAVKPKEIFDIGCGGGAVTNLFAEMFPMSNFTGIDVNDQYISISQHHKQPNSTFKTVDIYSDSDLKTLGKYDGVMSFQTLSWLPNYDQFLSLLPMVGANWALVTSLFYDGPVDAEIKIKDYTRTMGDKDYRECYYNIYSLDVLEVKLKQIGYKLTEVKAFDIGFDLPKPQDKSMSTYTEKTIDNRRIQISGPVLMSWHTLLISKIYI